MMSKTSLYRKLRLNKFRPHHLAEYTENTTIHGIKYLGDKQRPKFEKVFWITIFAICFVILGLFIRDLWTKWIQNSAILVDDDQPTSIYNVPFPAVTICPTVKIKENHLLILEQLNNISINKQPREMKIMDLMQIVCDQRIIEDIFSDRIGSILNSTHIDLLHEISPNFEETFNVIKFASKHLLSFENYRIGDFPFTPILTNEGVCFTFNLPSDIISKKPSLQSEYEYYNGTNSSVGWNPDYGYYDYPHFPRSGWGSGRKHGLNVVVNSIYNDTNTICQPTKIGYKITLHSPAVYPTTLYNFIPIQHNTVNKIKVTPKLTKTSSELRKHSPQVRQCFFGYERKLQYFTFYNRVNCKLECLANYTLKQYGCVHFSLPRSKNESICGSHVKINELYDTEENINSYFKYKKEISYMYDSELQEDEPIDIDFSDFQCNCLPECNSLEYEFSIESEDVDIEKLIKKYAHSNDVKELDPFSYIEIFFGVTKVTAATRRQYYTFSDLISNIGGLVGLFMGASILSIFEIIYFFILRKRTEVKKTCI